MARIPLKLEEIVDGAALRRDMRALTDATGGDGSSAAVRAAMLQLLKDRIGHGRAAAETMLKADGGGTACAARLSHLMDEVIRALYDFAADHVYRSKNPSAAERMAVVAVGGYGRGTLAPGSDIYLLFVLPYKQTPWGEQVVEYILYVLWDLGLKVGHATRNLDECMRLSRTDVTIRTSILEARFVTGDEVLFGMLVERFDRYSGGRGLLPHVLVCSTLASRHEAYPAVCERRQWRLRGQPDGTADKQHVHAGTP
jgi:[protein-PII] uridylyltransferase